MKEDFLKSINCLDKGFVRLVDYMGDDAAIVQAARVSYGGGTKTPEEDRSLIRYLLKNKHTTPIESCVFKFHVKAPIFCFRQWHRHRMSTISEISGRYTELPEECYIPELSEIKAQSKNSKQGRAEMLDETTANTIVDCMREEQRISFKAYKKNLNDGLAKELARINLPLSTYSEMYWKIDLHNLFHFLKLRMDSHAQYEMRVFANAIYELIKPIVPIACEAFDEYILNANSFSKTEMSLLQSMIKISSFEKWVWEKLNNTIEGSTLTSREKKEFIDKLNMGDAWTK
jgi:thymidylate synthase (FAD)